MSGKFITLIIAASIAVTGMTANPARAGDRDVARALAAIAGIAIIGAAIHDHNKNKRRHDGYVSSRGHGHKAHNPYRHQRKAHRQQRRQQELNRAYRQGYKAHRREVQQRRAHRHGYRRAYGNGYRQGYGQQRYSARPRYNY